MSEKNSFVLRTNYRGIFAEMSDKQAGTLIKAIFHYVATGDVPTGLDDVEVRMAFKFIRQDIDYDAQKYAVLCQKRAEAGRAGGRPPLETGKQKKHLVSQKANGFLKKQKKHDDNGSDVVSDGDKQQLHSAAKAAHGESEASPRKLNALQEFSNAVLAEFEDPMNDTQRGIWFKRNCRCLTDVLKFCEKDIPLALEAIRACVDRLDKAGLQGGYEAVCRNLPEYYAQAKKRLEVAK